MKKDVAIVFGITSNYTFALANVLIGMKKHCKPFWDDIIVYHDGVSDEEQEIINTIIPCKFIYFNESLFNDTAIKSEALKNYSLLTLARFECFGLLAEYRKIIWHDVDILVQKDFSGLLNYGDKSGFAATQSKDFRIEQNFFGLMPGYNMLGLLYNAGILVLSDNLTDYENLRKYCYNTFNEHAPKLRYNDQSVLNMMIQDFNINVELIDIDYYCCHPSHDKYSDAAIIHAYGSDKFWNSKKLENQFPEWHLNNNEWLSAKSTNSIAISEVKVSIIMSVYDRTEYLQKSVESILQQTFNNFEFIIVVEKCNTQNETIEFLKSYQDSRIVLISNDEKLGFSKSLNVGLAAAKGKYIARMDDDDISTLDRIEKQVRFLETHPEIDVVGSWIEIFGREHKIEKRPEKHDDLLLWSIKENPMFHPTVMIRKEILDVNGFVYDSNWLTEDYDLWLRMIVKVKFANIPEVLLYYRASNLNATVTKRDAVLNSHLDLMRRNLKEQLKLDFSRDEMLLLRHPHIVNECYNSDSLISLRNDVCQKIYAANDVYKVYDDEKLQQALGTLKVDLKTNVKSRLRHYPLAFKIVQKIYKLFNKSNKIDNQYSLFKRIKMRVLPPSSKSFHNWMFHIDNRLSIQYAEMEMLERRVIWLDEVVRRMYKENSAGLWGLYHTKNDVQLNNEGYRNSQYDKYLIVSRALQWLMEKVMIKEFSSYDTANSEWEDCFSYMVETMYKDIHIYDLNEQINKKEYSLAVVSYVPGKDGCVKNEVLNHFDMILCYQAVNTKKNDNLLYYKPQSMDGYISYDLRPVFEPMWELSDDFKHSVQLLILSERYFEIVSLIEKR